MDILLFSFIAAALAEWGDRTQLLAAVLVARGYRPGLILLAVAIAAVATSISAAIFGSLLATLVTERAAALLLVIAAAFAGVTAFIRQDVPERLVFKRLGAFASALLALLIVGFGDRTQVLTLALAAHYDAPTLVAPAAALGIVLASLPALVIGHFAKSVPYMLVRRIGGVLFLIAAAIAALQVLASAA